LARHIAIVMYAIISKVYTMIRVITINKLDIVNREIIIHRKI
jgi:hypothetical protein